MVTFAEEILNGKPHFCAVLIKEKEDVTRKRKEKSFKYQAIKFT